MLRSLKSLHSFSIAARDGDIGKLYDFFFDDDFWVVRYLVADTGHWLPGRKVLLSPYVTGRAAWDEFRVPADLTREQVKSSPDIDTAKPVSRRRQFELYQYYSWPAHWAGGGVWPNPVAPLPPQPTAVPREGEEEREAGDPHLRSFREITGYHIQASDGGIGHVDDFIVEDEVWEIRYLVVDTRNWIPGRKVLISPEWVVGPISWSQRQVKVFMTKDDIRSSPPFDPEAAVNREYEVRLYDYYGRPGYWAKTQSTAGRK